MDTGNPPLVLDILHQGNVIFLGIHELIPCASTVRNYSQKKIDFSLIEKLCQEIIATLDRATQPGIYHQNLDQSLRKSGQLLWDHLFNKSIKLRLQELSRGDLILSLDEELAGIPWELLYDGSDFLGLRFNVGRLIRTKRQPFVSRCRGYAERLKMLILANPTSDLEAAYQEGLHIKNKFFRHHKKIHIDFKSNHIDTLFVKKNLRDYDLVHFAGHCEYDNQNYKNTGWLFTDGRLTVGDILELGQSGPLPTLVFSNACESAKIYFSAPDYNYQKNTHSLASAFLFSATRHYIGLIWKVEDRVSLVFAETFYLYLFNGHSVGSSLRQARLELLKKFGDKTIYWSNYLLYGDPSFIIFRQYPRKNRIVFCQKERPRLKKIFSMGFAGGVVLVLIIMGLRFLPSLNPSAYWNYLRARTLFFQGKNMQAVKLIEGIVKKEPFFLAAYPILADAYSRQGKLEEALHTYILYSRNSERSRNFKHLASAYTAVGWHYQNLGYYKKAFDFYQHALKVCEKYKDKYNEALVLRKIGVWYLDNFQYDKALELFLKSSEINREHTHSPSFRYNLACDYFDIGLVFENKDDYVSAEKFYRKSLKIFSQLKIKSELSDYYFNLGEISRFKKEFHKATQFYLKGLALDEKQENFFSLATDYDMLGELYLDMGENNQAEKYFLKAIALAERIHLLPALASACYNIGNLYMQIDEEKASRYLKKAKEIYLMLELPQDDKIKRELQELN